MKLVYGSLTAHLVDFEHPETQLDEHLQQN